MQVAFLASSVLWCGAGPTFGLGFFRIVTFEHFGYFAAIIFSVGDVFSGKNLILGAGNPGLFCKIYEFMFKRQAECYQNPISQFLPEFINGAIKFYCAVVIIICEIIGRSIDESAIRMREYVSNALATTFQEGVSKPILHLYGASFSGSSRA